MIIPKTLRTLMRAYVFAMISACYFFTMQLIGSARTNDWIVIVDFNAFGEGYIEWFLLFIGSMLFIILGLEQFLKNCS